MIGCGLTCRGVDEPNIAPVILANTIKIKSILSDDRTQDVKLFLGCPVIAKKNCKKKGFVNNDQFVIKYINNDYMILEMRGRAYGGA